MMSESLAAIIQRLVAPPSGLPLAGIAVGDQFRPEETSPTAVARNLNAAFLLCLCGSGHPLHDRARAWLEQSASEASSPSIAGLFWELSRASSAEFAAQEDPSFRRAVGEAVAWCRNCAAPSWDDTARKHLWPVFFPEGVEGVLDPDGVVARLRKRRRVRITQLNPNPLRDPIRELLLTANALVTVPHSDGEIERLPCSAELRRRLRDVAKERQRYFYDHPIHIGVAPQAHEVLHGLRALDEAVAFEKKRGNARPDERLACVLSVSVTHDGLRSLVGDYLRQTLAAAAPTPHLDVYAFSESDVGQLVDRVLAPAAEACWGRGVALEPLRRVLGVDGEYGRHYSFLKAMAALWQVLVDPAVRATFKIDLDQAFPQGELVGQGGGSAFEHFRSPLWGARGVDEGGRAVFLGMLAGALVNENDIGRGLFTPDVLRPESISAGESTVFFNRLPMALSSEAEMMARYGGGGLDGVTACLQRFHVTGGTNGILVRALRQYRPFTPACIGRAEDQAYLLSVLFVGEEHLRYAHSSGLIMRHDKEAFAGASIAAAKTGRFVGDLMRTLYFSSYARSLPWPWASIKEQLDPFTGCFISRIPVTLVALRLALAAAERFAATSPLAQGEAVDMLALSAERLGPLVHETSREPAWLKQRLEEERQGWNLFYDLLDWLEAALSSAGPSAAMAAKLRVETMKLMDQCRIR